jgi:hypothetical protein
MSVNVTRSNGSPREAMSDSSEYRQGPPATSMTESVGAARLHR